MRMHTFSLDAFIEQATQFHGYAAPGLIIGGLMVQMAKTRLPQGILYDAISETAHCLPDAVQLLTPCTIGNGWLRVLPFGIYAVSLYDKHNGKGVRVELDGEKLDKWPAVRSWFLKELPKKDQDSEGILTEIKKGGVDMITLRPICVRQDKLRHRSFGAVARCTLCGTWHPAAFGRLCRSCQGESPYAEGPGIAFSLPQPDLRTVPVADAPGHHALHDMTRIVPNEYKGSAFVRDQVITAGDVCRLQQMGRNRVYVREGSAIPDEWIHEDTVAEAFARAMPGDGVVAETGIREGKVNFAATADGLLVVDTHRLARFNLLPDLVCATRHTHTVVTKGLRVAASRAIPLFLPRVTLVQAQALLDEGPLVAIRPMRKSRIGVLITGTEVFQGIIEDKFASVISQKAQRLGCEVVRTIIAPDEETAIRQGLLALREAGAEVIITTAGLSVDPDDVTRKALLGAGLTDALYGMPVLPGAMTLVGRIDRLDVIGVPACALYFKTTAFDLLFPLVLAQEPVTRQLLAHLGHGGLCMECSVCVFPKCPFGRG